MPHPGRRSRYSTPSISSLPTPVAVSTNRITAPIWAHSAQFRGARPLGLRAAAVSRARASADVEPLQLAERVALGVDLDPDAVDGVGLALHLVAVGVVIERPLF